MVALSDFNPFSGASLGGVMGKFLMYGFWTVLICGILLYVFFYIKNKRFYKTPVSLIIMEQNKTWKERADLRGGVTKRRDGVMDFKVKIPGQRAKKSLGYVPDYSKADSSGRLTFMRIGDGMLWQQINRKLVLEKDIEQVVQEVWYRNLSNNKEFSLDDFQEDLKKNTKQTNEGGVLKFVFTPTKQKYDLIDNLINANYLSFNKDVKKKFENYCLMSEPIPTDVKTVTINNIHAAENLFEKNKLTAWTVGIIAFVIIAMTQIIFLYFQSRG